MPGEGTHVLRDALASGRDGVVLHARPFRSVTRERDERGEAVIVKRFHHPNALLALFDGSRARREFQALLELERAGLPVPHPRELRRTRAGWEVHLAPVTGARALDELLGGGGAPPGGWARLVARLGTLLAALHATGWEHRDLHAGNVLVDAEGRPWLIDFHRSRRLTLKTERQRFADVVLAEAEARETLPPRVRARFLLAWWRALPEGLRPGNSRRCARASSELARTIEKQARLRRRVLVSVGLERWLRESSRVRVVQHARASACVRRDLDDSALETVADGVRFLVLRGAPGELRRRWLAAARLHEHRVPVARPAVFFLGGGRSRNDALAAFEPPVPGATAATAATIDELLQTLRERGLAPPLPATAEELASAGPAGFYFRPPRALREIDL